MATTTVQERLAQALSQMTNPRTGADLSSSQQVRDIATTTDGRVRATLQLGPQDDPLLARALRRAIENVAGVTDFQLEVATAPKTRPVLISSGKGGVGKSTLAVNLAVALARGGARVGLMDADIYGPNIPRMMGASGAPPVINDKIVPLEAHGVKLMSLGMMIEPTSRRSGAGRSL